MVTYQNALAKISAVLSSPTKSTKFCLVLVTYSSCLFSPIRPICQTTQKTNNLQFTITRQPLIHIML